MTSLRVGAACVPPLSRLDAEQVANAAARAKRQAEAASLGIYVMTVGEESVTPLA